MTDTIPYIVDSTRQVININVPGKSNLELILTLSAVGISVLAMFVNYYLTSKQIKENNKNIKLQLENSQKLLERTIKANRQDLIKEKQIETRLKLIDELIAVKDLCSKNMFDIKENPLTAKNIIPEFYNSHMKLLEILTRLGIDEKVKDRLVTINTANVEVIKLLREKKNNNQDYKNEDKQNSAYNIEFVNTIVEITEEEIKKINYSYLL